MARLNEAQKMRLRDKILKHTFEARRKVVTDDLSKLAADAYQSLGAEFLALLHSLPDGTVPRNDAITCYFGGQRYSLHLPESTPLPYRTYNNGLRFAVDDALTVRFEEIMRLDSQINKEEKELKSQLNALFTSVTTDKQLIQAWPGVEQYIPKEEMSNLPAPAAENLDNLIRKFSAS